MPSQSGPSVAAGVALAVLVLAMGCGTGAQRNDPSTTLYVDASVGSDLNPGTEAEPLKTITAALSSLVFSGGSVVVAPGVYDSQHGETFPLSVPNDVALRGDAENRGTGSGETRGTSIHGFAQISDLPSGNPGTVLLGKGSSITGFVVGQGHFNGYALSILADERAKIASCTLTGPGAPASPGGLGTFGVSIRPGAGGCEVRDCLIEGHHTGVALAGDSTHLLEANVIRDNRTGVRVQMHLEPNGADLGGGVAGSLGRNVIAGSGFDLWIIGNTHVSARDNVWDHAPPEVYVEPSPPPDGADVYISGGTGATVDLAGASALSP